ncbi:MAG: hypothetical protein ACYC1L_12285 [Alphaproteobacteria bacterium]
MLAWLCARATFLWTALWRPLPKWLLFAWAVLGFWDIIVAQLLPQSWAKDIPRLYEAVEMVTGYLPWWAWVITGLVIVTFFTVESAVRLKPVIPAAVTPATSPDEQTITAGERANLKYAKPDYVIFAQRTIISIREGAFLMADVVPGLPVMPPTVSANAKLLLEWMDHGRLQRADLPTLARMMRNPVIKERPNYDTGISLRQLVDILEDRPPLAETFVKEMRSRGVSRRSQALVETRRPLIELRDEASKRGWDFVSHTSLHILDFTDAMGQTALDGILRLWGRPDRNDFMSLTKTERLQEILPDHFKDGEIDAISLHAATDNFDVQTRNVRNGTKGFRDIHFSTENLKTFWVEADKFKGRRK